MHLNRQQIIISKSLNCKGVRTLEFETVIGLEVHVELKTDSKIFSASPNQFGAEPNTNTSVIDLGYPGVLPVLNKKVVDYGMKAAMALNCEVAQIRNLTVKTIFIQTIQRPIKFLNLISQLVNMAGLKLKWMAIRKELALLVFI